MSGLKTFLQQKVKVVTGDGRLFVGKLEGFDQSVNIILTNAIERIFDPVEETQELDLGLYVLRGDSVVCVGLVDEDVESQIDWTKVHGSQLKGTKNPL